MSPMPRGYLQRLAFVIAFFISLPALAESPQSDLSHTEYSKKELEMSFGDIPQNLADQATVYTINNQKVILTDQNTGSRLVSLWMIDLLNQNSQVHQATTFGLATGSAPVAVYKYLSEAYKAGQFTTEALSTVNLDEYIGLPANDPQSYRAFMRHHLINNIDLPESRFHIFTGAPISYVQTEYGSQDQEIKRFEEVLKENPRDIQLLGIGTNGHIAFNEPADNLTAETPSHIVELAESTRQSNSVYFQGEINQVPTHARTLGMKEILAAEKIVMLAWGSRKATAVVEGILGPVTPQLPASFLQTHPNVVWVVDQEAASLLLERASEENR